jgi:hypothetical protein
LSKPDTPVLVGKKSTVRTLLRLMKVTENNRQALETTGAGETSSTAARLAAKGARQLSLETRTQANQAAQTVISMLESLAPQNRSPGLVTVGMLKTGTFIAIIGENGETKAQELWSAKVIKTNKRSVKVKWIEMTVGTESSNGRPQTRKWDKYGESTLNNLSQTVFIDTNVKWIETTTGNNHDGDVTMITSNWKELQYDYWWATAQYQWNTTFKPPRAKRSRQPDRARRKPKITGHQLSLDGFFQRKEQNTSGHEIEDGTSNRLEFALSQTETQTRLQDPIQEDSGGCKRKRHKNEPGPSPVRVPTVTAQAALYLKNALEHSSGGTILVSGPAGCGKTHITKMALEGEETTTLDLGIDSTNETIDTLRHLTHSTVILINVKHSIRKEMVEVIVNGSFERGVTTIVITTESVTHDNVKAQLRECLLDEIILPKPSMRDMYQEAKYLNLSQDLGLTPINLQHATQAAQQNYHSLVKNLEKLNTEHRLDMFSCYHRILREPDTGSEEKRAHNDSQEYDKEETEDTDSEGMEIYQNEGSTGDTLRKHQTPSEERNPKRNQGRSNGEELKSETIPALRKILRTIMYREIGNQDQYWRCSEIKTIVTRHLVTLQEMYVNAMAAHPGLTWHSNLNGNDKLGATGGPQGDFLKNKFTWINLKESTLEQEAETNELRVTIETAMEESDLPARAVMICKDTPRSRTKSPSSSRTRTHTLMIIPPGTTTLQCLRTQGEEEKLNKEPLSVILIETVTAPPTDYLRLAGEVRTLGKPQITTYTPPWIPKDREYYQHEIPTLTARNPGHKHPAFSWYRTEPTREIGKPQLKQTSPTGLILICLGIGPQNLKDTLRRNGIPEEMITTEVMNVIKERIRSTSFKAFTRQKRWEQADKYGPQGARAEPQW